MTNKHFLNGKTINLSSLPPQIGAMAPDFHLSNLDHQRITLDDFKGMPLVIYTIPSIDSEICYGTSHQMNTISKDYNNLSFLCVSMDLPITLRRIDQTGKLHNVYLMSDFLDRTFGFNYGVLMTDGILAGLLARSVFVLDSDHYIRYQKVSQHVCHGFDQGGEELNGLQKAIDLI